MGVRTWVPRHEELRRLRGLTQAGVAGALGVTTAYVYRVEARLVAASPHYQTAFARLVGTVPDEVFNPEGRVL